MGVGSSKPDWSNSKQSKSKSKPALNWQGQPKVKADLKRAKSAPQQEPPTDIPAVKRRNTHGIQQPFIPPEVQPQFQQQGGQLHRSHSSRLPESRLDETFQIPMMRESGSVRRPTISQHRAYASEGQAHYYRPEMQPMAFAPPPHMSRSQPLRNPLPTPPKDLISQVDFSSTHYSPPKPFVPGGNGTDELKRSRTKGRSPGLTLSSTPGGMLPIAPAEPSSSFSSHSSASTSNPPAQVFNPSAGVPLFPPEATAQLKTPDGKHRRKGSGTGVFSSLMGTVSSRNHPSQMESGYADRPPRPSTSSAERGAISQPYMLAPRQHAHPAHVQPFFFFYPDEPGYGFTTFSAHKILYRKRLYPTAEHLYQSMKFYPSKGKGGNIDIAEQLRVISDSPIDVVMEGRRLIRAARPDWKEMRTVWMDEIMYMKFTQHPELRRELIDTTPAELIFASPDDAYWGLGPENRGRNELGLSLQRVRQRILREMGK